MVNIAARLSGHAQARAKREVADREDAELLRWLIARGVDFITLADGGAIDCANHPRGAHAAISEAQQSERA